MYRYPWPRLYERGYLTWLVLNTLATNQSVIHVERYGQTHMNNQVLDLSHILPGELGRVMASTVAMATCLGSSKFPIRFIWSSRF